jgi:hypothetical protein
MLSDPKRRESMGHAARLFVDREFSTRVIAEAFGEVLKAERIPLPQHSTNSGSIRSDTTI